jgi:hypothetical protein
MGGDGASEPPRRISSLRAEVSDAAARAPDADAVIVAAAVAEGDLNDRSLDISGAPGRISHATQLPLRHNRNTTVTQKVANITPGMSIAREVIRAPMIRHRRGRGGGNDAKG